MGKSKHGYPNLKASLKATGRTQAELAELVGIRQPYLSKILNGRQQPALRVATRIAAIADIPIESLLLSRKAA